MPAVLAKPPPTACRAMSVPEKLLRTPTGGCGIFRPSVSPMMRPENFQRKQRPGLSAALKQNNRILADLGSNILKVDDMNSNRTSYSKNDLENDQFRDQAEPQQ